jgi:lysophospholipase L1-like esterase
MKVIVQSFVPGYPRRRIFIKMEKPPVSSRKRWLAFLLAVYILGLHAVIVVALFKTDIVARIIARVRTQFGSEVPFDSRAFQVAHFQIGRINQMMREAPVVFLGDSITQGLPAFRDMPRSLNLGIGGNTIPGVTAMVGTYGHIDQVTALVLNIGVNDLCNEGSDRHELEQRLRRLSSALPIGIRMVWSSILPVDPNGPQAICRVQPDAIRHLNSLIADICKARDACLYSDGFSSLADARGYLAPQFHIGDGVHLSPFGYATWSTQIRRDLVRSGAQDRERDARPKDRTGN